MKRLIPEKFVASRPAFVNERVNREMTAELKFNALALCLTALEQQEQEQELDERGYHDLKEVVMYTVAVETLQCLIDPEHRIYDKEFADRFLIECADMVTNYGDCDYKQAEELDYELCTELENVVHTKLLLDSVLEVAS